MEVLSWFRSMVKEKKEDAYIVAEVWTDQNTYAKYYESGIDSCFDFLLRTAPERSLPCLKMVRHLPMERRW